MQPSILRPISMPSATLSRTRSICLFSSVSVARASPFFPRSRPSPRRLHRRSRPRHCAKMAERGQITGGVLDGPLAYDNAIDPKAAETKGIRSEVAGRAQILIVPDAEACNMLVQSYLHAQSRCRGPRVPGQGCRSSSRREPIWYERASLLPVQAAVLYADARRRASKRRPPDDRGDAVPGMPEFDEPFFSDRDARRR